MCLALILQLHLLLLLLLFHSHLHFDLPFYLLPFLFYPISQTGLIPCNV